MDPVFPNLLPGDSNLVRLQKEFYLFPFFIGSGNAMPIEVRISEDSHPTTMELRFARYLEAGGRFNSGAGFMVTDGFEWGSCSTRHLPV